MNNTILDWRDTDYREIYQRQIRENPLYYNPGLKTWVVYSYAHCIAVLQNKNAWIPQPVLHDDSPLNDKARLLLTKLARLGNDGQHLASRGAAMVMYQKIAAVDAGQLLKTLLSAVPVKVGFDWIETVAKQLPVKMILSGLGFDEEDSAYVTGNIATLVQVMLPTKTDEDIEAINPVVDRFFEIAERYLSDQILTVDTGPDDLMACNLIGLFIQCYDAAWGLLCNMLLRLADLAGMPEAKKTDDTWYKKLVNETLRWDPPVHNTRRIAVNDISIDGQTIKKGETIQVVLAAANLDPEVFNNAGDFDLERSNNAQHLTFGIGGHNCIAKYLCIDMVVDVCRFLAANYKHISILQNEFNYASQLNVRLVKQLMISLS